MRTDERPILHRLADRLAVRRSLLPVRNRRGLGKADLPENGTCPQIDIDPRSFAVRIDGRLIVEDPVSSLPLAQRYSLF